jgi:hypothetical protein
MYQELGKFICIICADGAFEYCTLHWPTQGNAAYCALHLLIGGMHSVLGSKAIWVLLHFSTLFCFH